MFIRVCFFFVSLIACTQTLFAQTSKSDKALASEAFALGNYDLALYTYNRLAFANLPAVDAELEMQIGLCYLEKKDFEKASQFFDKAFFSSPAIALKNEAILNKCRALIGQNSYPLALNELYSIDLLTLDSIQKPSYYLFAAVCHYEMEQFEAAEQSFLALVMDSSTIQAYFSKPKAFYRPNSTLALVMSAVLPGSGQFYAGEYKEGINSLIINSFFLYYWVRVLNLYGGFDAFLAVLPWFQRYYVGGFNRASLLSYEKMLATRKVKLAEILAEINRQTP